MTDDERAVLVAMIAFALCPPEASYCRERMIEEGDAAHIVASVEAAGWGPRPAPLTDEDYFGLFVAAASTWVGYDSPSDAIDAMLNAVLRSDVLRRRGIVVEGES